MSQDKSRCGCCGEPSDSLIYMPMLAVCVDCARYAVESVMGNVDREAENPDVQVRAQGN